MFAAIVHVGSSSPVMASINGKQLFCRLAEAYRRHHNFIKLQGFFVTRHCLHLTKGPATNSQDIFYVVCIYVSLG